MTLSEAFDNLKSARREDDGSAEAAGRLHDAAEALCFEAFEELVRREQRHPKVKPEPTPFSIEWAKKVMGYPE